MNSVRTYGTEVERALSKTERPSLFACWEWQAMVNNEGYGTLRRREPRSMVLAHRVLYEEFQGPIPSDRELDHLCRNRRCVNPFHLQPVTHSENLGRRPLPAPRTHCPNRHEYTPENTRPRTDREKGNRACRICESASNRRSYERRRLS